VPTQDRSSNIAPRKEIPVELPLPLVEEEDYSLETRRTRFTKPHHHKQRHDSQSFPETGLHHARTESQRKKRVGSRESDEGDWDLMETDFGPKKKTPRPKVEENIKREVFLPEAISVSNLARIIGVRLGERMV
jgi:hypothetical protein